MAEIKKIYEDGAGTTQIYPQTHTKAVVDDNGNTVESKLGALGDLINQKQLAIGAVPIDTEPTDGNTDHIVSSDAVYKGLQGIDDSNLYWQAQATFPTNGFITNVNTWYVKTNYTHAHFSAQGVKRIKITSNATNITNLAFLRTYTVPGVEAPDLCDDVIVISTNTTKEFTVPSDCAYIAVSMQGGTNSYAPQSVYVGRETDTFNTIIETKEGILRQVYSGCTLCIIGDSISTYQGDVREDATYQYPAKAITSLDMMYYKRLVDNLGFKSYINLSYGGSGVIRYDQSATHPSLFERVMLLQEPTDVIIIELSVNDFGHQVSIGTPDYDTDIEEMGESTFYDAYIKGVKELMRKFPNAQIIPLLTEAVEDTNDAYYTIPITDYQDAVRNIAAHYGFTIIDASGSYSTYGYAVNGSGDIHPRSTEMELLYYSCLDNLLENQRKNKNTDDTTCEILTPINLSAYPTLPYALYDGYWDVRHNFSCKIINVEPCATYRIKSKDALYSSAYVLTEDNHADDEPAMFATGFSQKKSISTGKQIDFITPSDGRYLCVTITAAGVDREPQAIYKVEKINATYIKNIADDYYNEGNGVFHIGGADNTNGQLDNTNKKLGRTDFIKCSGILNISINVPDNMSVEGVYFIKYNDNDYVDSVELDATKRSYSIKVEDFNNGILRLFNNSTYTQEQWSNITYSYATGMKFLISNTESSSVEDKRIDYVRSIQTKTKVLEIEDQEMIPTKGVCITSHGGHLYCSIDGVKYEINKTQI